MTLRDGLPNNFDSGSPDGAEDNLFHRVSATASSRGEVHSRTSTVKCLSNALCAHGGMAGDGGNGSAAFGAADEIDRGLDLRRDGGSVLRLDPAQEKAFHRDELPLYRMLIGQDVLDVLDLLPRQNVLEWKRSIVKTVGTIMQDGRRPPPR